MEATTPKPIEHTASHMPKESQYLLERWKQKLVDSETMFVVGFATRVKRDMTEHHKRRAQRDSA
jgi:hypothetical protein